MKQDQQSCYAKIADLMFEKYYIFTLKDAETFTFLDILVLPIID